MKTITDVIVRSKVDIKPASHNLLEGSELNDIVRQTEKKIIASHYLRPFQSPISDLQNR